MKKKLIAIILAVLMILALCGFTSFGYNKQLFDLTYAFNEAVIGLPNGEYVRGKVDSWTDYENSDQIQVTVDGVTYYTHSVNVVLITK